MQIVQKTQQPLTDFTATVFPNPATGMVTVELNAPVAQTLSIQICGTDGKVIEQIANTLEEGTTQIPLSIATLKAGVYTVKVNGENTLKTIKLIVQ
jgi:RNase P/RNase MRP subunit p29